MYVYGTSKWLKPVQGGVDGSLHFPLTSMSRLSQIEPLQFCCFGFSLGVLFSEETQYES